MLHARSALLASLLLVPATTHAALSRNWPKRDLDTLVVESDAIVLAERVGTRQVGAASRPVTLTRYRLVKVYRGAHLPGEEIELRDYYPRTSSGPFFEDPPSFDPRVIIFLEKADDAGVPATSCPGWLRRTPVPQEPFASGPGFLDGKYGGIAQVGESA